MAFEPSWLGDQLVVFYVPLLIASVLLKRSVFNFRLFRFSVEWILLIWSIFILVLTRSRISYLSLLTGIAVIIVYAGVGWFWRLIGDRASENRRLLIQITALALFLLALFVLLLVSGWILSRVDDRMVMMFSIPSRLNEFAYFYPGEAHFEIANSLAFAERVVYWAVGWRTFSAYPILGVGPGNMGFFFERFLPHYGYQLTEMQNVLELAEFGFPNPKNLWIRLLAEGGILGFSSYVVWYLLLAIGAFSLWREGSGIFKLVGLASTIAAVTMTIEGFSIDTYALPYNWIIFGLLTASLVISGFLVHPGGFKSGEAKLDPGEVA
jgi:O-antigen ligase